MVACEVVLPLTPQSPAPMPVLGEAEPGNESGMQPSRSPGRPRQGNLTRIQERSAGSKRSSFARSRSPIAESPNDQSHANSTLLPPGTRTARRPERARDALRVDEQQHHPAVRQRVAGHDRRRQVRLGTPVRGAARRHGLPTAHRAVVRRRGCERRNGHHPSLYDQCADRCRHAGSRQHVVQRHQRQLVWRRFQSDLDRLRVVNDGNENFRINPNNGARADIPTNDTDINTAADRSPRRLRSQFRHRSRRRQPHDGVRRADQHAAW